MSNNPVTEARLIELLKVFKEDFKKELGNELQVKFDAIDRRFDAIYSELKEIKGFQRHEADAIEFELDSVLKKYLKKTYFRMNITKFPIKHINDPYTHEELTDFDAAFLLTPLKHEVDYSRLAAASITIPSKKNQIKEGNTFILAEAKHYINREKIKRKLWQFDRIINIFNLAKKIKGGETVQGVHKKFMTTVQRNPFLANIESYTLFFGAAYWEKGLMDDFEDDVAKYKALIDAFNNEKNDNRKVILYKQLCEIEMEWYSDKATHISTLTVDEITQLGKIDGAMKYVEFIQPSGERYSVKSVVSGPVGIASLSIGAGGLKKTMRKKI